MEGLDLLGVKEPEDEILHQPRPRTVTTTSTTPTTPATLRKRAGTPRQHTRATPPGSYQRDYAETQEESEYCLLS